MKTIVQIPVQIIEPIESEVRMTREAITEKELLEMLRDDEFEITTIFTIKTPKSKEVPFIKLEVLDKIRAEIEELPTSKEIDYITMHFSPERIKNECLKIINKHIGDTE